MATPQSASFAIWSADIVGCFDISDFTCSHNAAVRRDFSRRFRIWQSALVAIEELARASQQRHHTNHQKFLRRQQEDADLGKQPGFAGYAACDQRCQAVRGQFVSAGVVVGVKIAVGEVGESQDFGQFLFDGRQVGHGGDSVEFQHALAAQHANAVVEGVLVGVVGFQFAGPVHFVGLLVVVRRFGPAQQVQAGVALFLAFLIVLGIVFLHLLEQFGVVDFCRVFVGNMPVVLVADDDAPAACRQRADGLGYDHAQGVEAWRVAPAIGEQAFGVLGVEVVELVVELERGDAAGQGDGAGLLLEGGEEVFGGFGRCAGFDRRWRCGGIDRRARQAQGGSHHQ